MSTKICKMIYNIKTLKIGIPAAFSIDFQLTNDKKREKSSLRIVVNEGYHQNITLRILNSVNQRCIFKLIRFEITKRKS